MPDGQSALGSLPRFRPPGKKSFETPRTWYFPDLGQAMNAPDEVSSLDRVLDHLEKQGRQESNTQVFLSLLLEQLRLVAAASSARMVAPLTPLGAPPANRLRSDGSAGSSGRPRYITLAAAGETATPDLSAWLGYETSRPADGRPAETENATAALRSVRRRSDSVDFAVGLDNDSFDGGAVVLTLPGSCPAAAESGVLDLVEAFGEIVSDRLHRDRRRCHTHFERLFDRVLAELYQARDRAAVIATAAHDMPHLLGCPRIAVARQHGKQRWRVAAVTGAESVTHRTEAIRELERLAARTNDARRPLLLQAPANVSLSSADDGGAAEGRTVPANDPDTLLLPMPRTEAAANGHPRSTPVTDVAIVQWSPEHAEIHGIIRRLQRIYPHLLTAYAATGERERSWLSRGLSRFADRRRGLRPLLAALAVTFLAAIALPVINQPVDFNIEATGTLEPVDTRTVFASRDGSVLELLAAEGNRVRAGERLVQLRSADLELRQRELEGEFATSQRRLEGLKVALNQLPAASSESLADSRRLAAEVDSMKQKLTGLAALQKLLQEQRDALTLRSPISGTVVTWDARRQLETRPVRRGDAILKVAKLSGPWRLRLWLPDREVAHVTRAITANISAGVERADTGLPVTFKLLSRPGESYRGHVASIGSTVQTRAGRGPVVRVDVFFDRDEIDELQLGSTARAQLHCGQRSWLYVWTRTLRETLQRRFWSLP